MVIQAYKTNENSNHIMSNVWFNPVLMFKTFTVSGIILYVADVNYILYEQEN